MKKEQKLFIVLKFKVYLFGDQLTCDLCMLEKTETTLKIFTNTSQKLKKQCFPILLLHST